MAVSKQDARVATMPQPCVSPALCQGHADLPECADIDFDDELDCPEEPAADFDAESSGKSRFPSYRVLTAHHVVYRQMGKKTTTIHTPISSLLTPPPPPLPVHLGLRLPALTSYTRSFVLVRARIAILQQESSLIHEKESRLPNGFLAAPISNLPSFHPGLGCFTFCSIFTHFLGTSAVFRRGVVQTS
jgi:hypothetical protein